MLDKILLITISMLLFVTIESYEVSSVSCGNHRASSCSACPQGHGKNWCHGSCRWQNGQCIPKGSGSSQGTSYAQQELRKHNTYRARHGAPPLSLDSSLSADAEYYARVLVSKGDLEHSNGNYGENLSIKCPGGKSATDGWYKEVENYNYRNPGFAQNTGHFTQIVWKGSKRLGVGKAKGKWKGYDCEFIVARYTPAGNVRGAFPENVGRS